MVAPLCRGFWRGQVGRRAIEAHGREAGYVGRGLDCPDSGWWRVRLSAGRAGCEALARGGRPPGVCGPGFRRSRNCLHCRHDDDRVPWSVANTSTPSPHWERSVGALCRCHYHCAHAPLAVDSSRMKTGGPWFLRTPLGISWVWVYRTQLAAAHVARAGSAGWLPGHLDLAAILAYVVMKSCPLPRD